MIKWLIFYPIFSNPKLALFLRHLGRHGSGAAAGGDEVLFDRIEGRPGQDPVRHSLRFVRYRRALMTSHSSWIFCGSQQTVMCTRELADGMILNIKSIIDAMELNLSTSDVSMLISQSDDLWKMMASMSWNCGCTKEWGRVSHFGINNSGTTGHTGRISSYQEVLRKFMWHALWTTCPKDSDLYSVTALFQKKFS